MKEVWTNISGSGDFLSWKDGASLTIESEVFTATESGVKVQPTAGVTITVRGEDGQAKSFRLIHSMCGQVADVIVAAHAESDKAVRALGPVKF